MNCYGKLTRIMSLIRPYLPDYNLNLVDNNTIYGEHVNDDTKYVKIHTYTLIPMFGPPDEKIYKMRIEFPDVPTKIIRFDSGFKFIDEQ